MAIEVREQVPTTVRPVALPSRTRLADVGAWLVVSVLMGVAAGAMIHSLLTAEDRGAYAAQVQSTRAAATVQAYEQAWASLQPAQTQVRVSGTGPALASVAEQQLRWSEHAVTGTGPGLVTLAELQAGQATSGEPTGTGPGLEHLPGPAGPEVAVVGTP